jgi:hypothetical protein
MSRDDIAPAAVGVVDGADRAPCLCAGPSRTPPFVWTRTKQHPPRPAGEAQPRGEAKWLRF